MSTTIRKGSGERHASPELGRAADELARASKELGAAIDAMPPGQQFSAETAARIEEVAAMLRSVVDRAVIEFPHDRDKWLAMLESGR